MLDRVKSIIPNSWRLRYHFLLANIAAVWYGFPSSKMRTIGVTGTNGKSSTVQIIGQLLMNLGKTVGWTTTVSFRIGNEEWVNDKKMTMLGRFATQKALRKMKDSGCKYAIVETSSQGILQYRHIGIQYDSLVFTNLTPEHIEAHGGFDKYKHAKLALFSFMEKLPDKVLDGVRIPRNIIVNLDDQHSGDFVKFKVDRTLGWTCDSNRNMVSVDEEVKATEISYNLNGTRAKVNGHAFESSLVGPFYFKNTLAAITALIALGYSLDQIMPAVKTLHPIQGRLETFTHRGVTIIVDYAYEPYALKALYETVLIFNPVRIIHVTGSAGGGRDVARRTEIGRLASEHDDIVIVTNEDPYDDDPLKIMDDVSDGARMMGKKEGIDLFQILDRAEAIRFAVQQAKSGDVVLITGKGSEPVMAVSDGRKVPFDDRAVVRDIISE